MGWEKRRGKACYYYRKRRAGGRVLTEYCGAGQAGERAAAQEGEAAQARAAARETLRLMPQEVLTVDTAVQEVCDLIQTFAESALLATGHHAHKGEWRKGTRDS